MLTTAIANGNLAHHDNNLLSNPLCIASPTQKNYKLAVDAMQLACEVLAFETFDEERLTSPQLRPFDTKRLPETADQQINVPPRGERRDFGLESLESLARCTCAYGRQLVSRLSLHQS